MHHIISDAWSIGVLMQESEAIFNAFSSGRPSPLEELEIQYADYAQWQREWLQGEVLASELHYWRKQLAGAPTVLDLPTDHPRPTARTQPGKHCRLTLPANLSKRLREFAREEGVTVFMTLMAAFQALLTRYTGQDDILVGTPIAGRGRLALEDLIGFFVNMVVLRADLHAAPTFRGLVRQVRESALGAYAHQDLPFDKLVEGLRPERGVGRNPLFQVVLAFQNAPAPALAVSGATLPSAGLGSADAKFDLELYLWNAADELSGSFFYSPELFENATVTRMVAHFESLLEQVVVRADASLSDFCFMTQAEVHQIIEEWNDTDIECPAETCVHHFVETQTRETPMAIALEWEDRQMTYRELDQRANQLAHYLRKLGIGPEVPVGICLERGLNMVVGLLAILKAGGAYVPMDLDYPAERLAYVLRDASVGVLLTQERLIEKFPQQERKVSLDKDWELIAKESDEPVDSKVVPGNLAYIIYTSGSTGHPKGVMVRHSSLSNLIAWHNRTYGVTCADRATQLAGIAFDAATWEIWPYLTAGARLLLPRAQGIEVLSNWLAEQKVSICFLATPLAEAVIRDLPLETPLRYLLTGGDALHRIDKQFGFKFVNHYGPTESTVLATCAMVDCSLPGDPPIGRPIANTRIYILDKHLRCVPIGVTGEIYIGGAGVARGYWKRPSLTAERFLPDPFSVRPGACLYRTGDAGCYLPDGTVEFKGRIDRQIKIRGFRVELGEIESVLSLHPKVKEAVVVVREATPGSKRLVAYVIPKEEPALASDELKQYLKERLPEYMVPSVYVTLESLPLTPNGKVDRPALPEPDHRLYRSEKAYIPPQDQLQEQLAKMWEELLGTGPIGAKDDFFELGGHSLLAVQLISRIEERFGKRVPMTALFEEATIERLSHFLREETGTQDSSLLVPIQPNGTNPPLYFVHAAGGHVLFYAPLARYLNQEQPFYGMQARDSGKDAPPHSQLEAMAAEYVAVIRGFQPVGPYMVGGWSMGGVIAFEMARQLVDQKHKVAVLALIDSKAPSKKAAEYRSLELLAGFARDLGMRLENLRSVWEELVRLPPMAQLNRVWSQAKSAKLIPPDMTLADFRKLFDSFKTKAHMLHSYAGGSYSGRISLFRAEQAVEPIVDKPENLAVDPDPTRGWAQFAAEGVEIYPIPGQHFTMLQEPNVKTLAEQLHICIHNAAKEAK